MVYKAFVTTKCTKNSSLSVKLNIIGSFLGKEIVKILKLFCFLEK